MSSFGTPLCLRYLNETSFIKDVEACCIGLLFHLYATKFILSKRPTWEWRLIILRLLLTWLQFFSWMAIADWLSVLNSSSSIVVGIGRYPYLSPISAFALKTNDTCLNIFSSFICARTKTLRNVEHQRSPVAIAGSKADALYTLALTAKNGIFLTNTKY